MTNKKPISTQAHLLLSGELYRRGVKHENEYEIFRPGVMHCARCVREWDDPEAQGVVGQYSSAKHFEECQYCHSMTASTKSYSLDIFIPHKSLCIEIDGESHNSVRTQKKDRWRTEFLNSRGIKVVRLKNKLVESYCEEIAELVAALV